MQSTPHLAILQQGVDSNRDATATLLKHKAADTEAPTQHNQSRDLWKV